MPTIYRTLQKLRPLTVDLKTKLYINVRNKKVAHVNILALVGV